MPIEFLEDTPRIQFLDTPETVYREDTQLGVKAPNALTGGEFEYLDNIQNNSRQSGEHFGFVDMGVGTVQNMTKGFLAGIVRGSADIATLDQARIEKQLEQIKVERREFEPIDVLLQVAPTVKGRFAEIRVSEKFGGKQTFKTEQVRLNERLRFFNDIQKKTPHVIKEMGLDKIEGNLLTDVGYDFGAGVQSLVQSVGATVITGNPSAATILFAAQQKSRDYQEARDAGFGVDVSNQAANLTAATAGAIEFLGTGSFVKILGKSSKLKRAASGFFVEAIEEGTQEFADIMIKNDFDITDTNFKDGAQQVAYSAFIGGLVGAPVSVVMAQDPSISEQMGMGQEQAVELAKAIEGVVEQNTEIQGEVSPLVTELVDEQLSELKGDPDSQKKVQKIYADFVSGKDIDTTGLTDAENRFLTDLEGLNVSLTTAEQQEITRVQVEKGRLTEIDKQISTIDKQISVTEDLRAERIEAGKPVKAVDNKIDKLIEQREKLDVERVNLIELPVAVRKVAGKEVVSVKAKIIEKLGIKAQEEKVRGFQRGIREGIKLAKTDIKASQDFITNVIKTSGLSLNDQAKFLTTLKNIQSSSQALKELPIINSRISRLLEKNQRSKIKTSIKNALKKTKAKKVSGKPVSKFAEANVQQTLDALRDASKLTKQKAEEKIVANLELGADITPEIAMENKVLSIMADTGSVPIGDMIDTLVGVNELIETGKTTKRLKEASRREKLLNVKDQFVQGISRGKDLENISKLDPVAKFEKIFNEIRAAESGLNNGWFDTLDLMLGKTSDKLFNIKLNPKVSEGDKARDFLVQGVARAINEEKTIAVDFTKRFVEKALDSYGLTNTRRLQRMFIQDERVQLIGTFKREGAASATRWELSRAQARKLWMELQDPTLRDTLTSKEGNGITEEMEFVLTNDFLTSQDLIFAQAQLDLYKEFYPKVDNVYADTYGIHLPDNPFYSPIRRRKVRDTIVSTNDFLEELKARQSTVPSFGKLRTNTNLKIVEQSDVSVMMNHIAQASHFISMSETARDLNSIFSDPAVRNSIEATFGMSMMENIDNYVKDFTVGHIERAEGWSRALAVLNKNFSVSALGLKPNLYPKQMVSIFAFASDIPTASYIQGLSSFAANPAKAIRILSSTSFMQTRGASQDVDIVRGSQDQAGKLLGKKQTIDNLLLLSTRLGDRGAIYMGGWAVYQHNIKQGKTHEQALEAFVEAARITQQSSDLDQLSRLQASRNPFYRAMTMFMSSPNAYWRAEKRAIRQLVRGKIPPQEAAKKIFIFHFLLPMLFQYMSDGFEFDEKNQTRAAVLGSLNGFMILGSVLVDAVAAAQGVYFQREDLNFVTGVSDLFLAGAKSFKNGEIEFKDIMDSAGLVFGTPNKQIDNIIEGIEDINKGDPEKGIKRVFGWTERTAGSQKGTGLGKISTF